ncbi:deoxycytidylate deaminase [Aliarcobacter cryaerophilus]|uniref:deoxycytidylate deaminase n=1 Tax=Aliarcobacter cryaerophilus TaxID=28198 RepID=UPI003DA2708E
MVEAINQIYKHRQDFILIGLTGKIGAGCTTTADFMTKDIPEHNLPPLTINDSSSDITRKKYIIHNFYKSNWKPFRRIIASDIITSFLLEKKFKELNEFFEDNKIKSFSNDFKDEYKSFYEEYHSINFKEVNKKSFDFITTKLPIISKRIKEELGSSKEYNNYSKIYQLMGDNLRLYGDIFKLDDVKYEKIFTISERINKYIKIIRAYNESNKEKTYIVIDAFRNPFEVMFFKERYSAFYLMAINANEKDIEDRLTHKFNMTIKDIKDRHLKENPDDLVKDAKSFVSQNIKPCIQKSDLHISNNGKTDNNDFYELYGQIIKYVSLIQHPGLITPSLDEKMMQVAHTAKLNSACLSRQVGASITNEFGSLKAIGWNSVGDGQTPCLLRNKDELLQGTKSISFSIYEKSEIFKSSIKKFYPNINSLNLKGRNQSFCFKTIYNKQENDKNQVHTRSLHAEENAFLQIAKYGGEGIKNGTLYSTASPCELCSKKAYQLGIKRIVYIDPYPGIAQTQILNTGLFPPKIVLFKGAIGTAYHKLYDPILSYKDELSALANL